jgi:hypothetical protein
MGFQQANSVDNQHRSLLSGFTLHRTDFSTATGQCLEWRRGAYRVSACNPRSLHQRWFKDNAEELDEMLGWKMDQYLPKMFQEHPVCEHGC